MRAALVAALGVLLLALAAGAQTPPPRDWPPPDAVLPPARGTPDWSWAGYRSGDEPIPFLPDARVFDVKREFGAKGDGEADDTEALQAAVAAAADSHKDSIVYLPAGSFRLTKPLEVTASGVVIRGAGERQTRIAVDRALADVEPGSWRRDRAGRVVTKWGAAGGFIQFRGAPDWSGRADTLLARVAGPVAPGAQRIPVAKSSVQVGQLVRVFAALGQIERQVSSRVAAVGPGWVKLERELPFAIGAGWAGSLHLYAPTLQDSGVEKLTVRFDGAKPHGAHATDRGYNAIAISDAANVWVQQVTVENADNALILTRIDHATLLDVTVATTAARWAPPDAVWRREGHHAILLTACHDVLVSRFDIKTRFHHDLALAAGALLNVFSGGRGLDLNLHHEAKTGVLANLFTDLDMGRGNRPWASPGAGAAGPRAAFYNLRVALETLEEPAVQPPTQQPEGQASVTFPATGCGAIEAGINFFRGDLKKIPGINSLEACVRACRDMADCFAVTLVTASWGGCYAKAATGWSRKQLAAAQSVVVQCPMKQAQPTAAGCGVVQQGTKLVGADLADKLEEGSMDECAAACRANPDCGAATFMDYSWGRGCYLKRASGGWEQQASESAQSLVLCPRLAARQALEEEPLPPQLQRRRLAAFASLRPLPLPPCTFGEGLAFFGSWAGRQCPGWLVAPLNSSMPEDIYNQQWVARGNGPPVGPKAHRPVPQAATEACRTWMGDSKDPLECHVLLFDHCIPGYTNRNAIPRHILDNERKVLDALFASASRDGDFGSPPVRPAQYSRVCVANRALAGKGACRKVAPDSHRIHVLGFNKVPGPRCDNVPGQISFVKAHINGKHQPQEYGRVGH